MDPKDHDHEVERDKWIPPTEDYPTEKSGLEDQYSILYPNGPVDDD